MSSSRPTHQIGLIEFAVSLIPLMVTRLLLSLRKASHPEAIAEWNIDHFTGFYATTTTTITGDHSSPSDTQNTIGRPSKIELVDLVSELPDFESQGKRHPGALDGGV